MTALVEGICQTLVAGLLIGAIYGIMCVGLGLIFGVMRVINFAHGDFMMLGMYAAFYCFTALGFQTAFGSNWGPFLSILMAGPVLAAFGYIVHRTLISRVSGMRAASLDGEGHHELGYHFGVNIVREVVVGGRVVVSGGRREAVSSSRLRDCQAEVR